MIMMQTDKDINSKNKNKITKDVKYLYKNFLKKKEKE